MPNDICVIDKNYRSNERLRARLPGTTHGKFGADGLENACRRTSYGKQSRRKNREWTPTTSDQLSGRGGDDGDVRDGQTVRRRRVAAHSHDDGDGPACEWVCVRVSASAYEFTRCQPASPCAGVCACLLRVRAWAKGNRPSKDGN